METRRTWLCTALATLVAAASLLVTTTGSATDESTPTDGVAVSVVGNQLVDGSGHPLRLVGVDRSGTEYGCVQGWGIFDGPSDAASVAAIASWDVNAVRVPLNEDCWLGTNGVSSTDGGAAYRQAIQSYVHELNQAGMAAILDLHWGAPGSQPATGQEMMPDADHASAFWSSVAGTFVADPGVVFDLFNEPHDVGWSCWLDGCETPAGYQAVGMQSLIGTVRATGATQPIMVEPLDGGGDLSGFLGNAPVDPDNQLVASVHLYNTSACNTPACWNDQIAPVARRYPVVTGELGETDCSSRFIDSYMSWADAHGISYLAWTWDAGGDWTCNSGPALLDDYSGTPNVFGAGFRTHLTSLATVDTVYQLDHQWGNGGIGALVVVNNGAFPVGTTAVPWTFRFTLPNAESISSIWNATLDSHGDDVVTGTAPSFAPVLEPGQSITIGYVFNGNPATTPTEIDVNGAATGS